MNIYTMVFFDIDVRLVEKDEYVDLCKKAILNRVYVLFYIDPVKCDDRYEEVVRYALLIRPDVAKNLIKDVSLSRKITKEMLKEIDEKSILKSLDHHVS